MRIIQFLNCDIKSIIEQLDNIKKQNFDTIQINPVQPFINVKGYDWWATYQPLDFKIGNIYGTKKDLIILCHEAKKRGLSVVVDVITNHLANDGEGRETIPHRDINENIRNNEDYWKKHSKVNDFKTYKDIIEESIGLPGLNLRNKELQDIILNFLNELKDCGVDGFRFDAAKHIGLPSDGVSYFRRVNEFLEKNNLFAYSEFLDGPSNIQEILNEKKNEFADLMYVLTEENSEVKDSSKKVTFAASHDTDLNEYGCTRNKSTEEVINEYSELTKKFEHTLFYVRDKNFGKKIPDNNPDRMKYMDTTWINSKKLRQANLNTGKEYELEEKERKEKMDKKEKTMELHHQLSCNLHKIILNQIKLGSSINEIIELVILDYTIQSILNCLLGVVPYDEFLMDCVVGEFYENKNKNINLSQMSYEKFYIGVLNSFKNRMINELATKGLEQKIRKLEKKSEEPKSSIYGID